MVEFGKLIILVMPFTLTTILLANTKEACKALSKFSDKEVKSVFRFIYDNPHPQRKYFQEDFEKLKNNIAQYDKRLSELLTESYEKLMSEDHSH